MSQEMDGELLHCVVEHVMRAFTIRAPLAVGQVVCLSRIAKKIKVYIQ